MSNTISPDFSGITVKWAGTYMDGSLPTGRLLLSYNGGAMLDDDTAVGGIPVSVFPKDLSLPLTTTTIMVDGVSKTVAYCEAVVPATNDPDIAGSGGTYTFTEDFTGGRSGISFIADIDAPGGEVWLNKIAGTEPVQGETLSVVYYADFTDLETRVDALEAGGTGGGTVDLSNYYDKTETDALLGAKADDADLSALDARVVTLEGSTGPDLTAYYDKTETDGLLAAKADTTDVDAAFAALTKADVGLDLVDDTADVDKPVSGPQQSALDDKADIAHSHDVGDLPPYDITVSWYKAGGWHGNASEWPAVRPGSVDGKVTWDGPLSAGIPAAALDYDNFDMPQDVAA